MMSQKTKKAKKRYMEEYRKTHKEQIKEFRKAHASKRKQYMEKYYKAHVAEIKQSHRKWVAEHKEQISKHSREYKQNVKYIVYSHYSQGEPKCARCEIDDIDVLCIDHINNDGAEQRKTTGTGTNLVVWLRKNNYPEGYQVLCANCNLKKEMLRIRNALYCPARD